MSSFEDRKKSFEKKFAHDEEKQFKISARRNRYLGEWVSQLLGYNSDQEKEYIQAVKRQAMRMFFKRLKMILKYKIFRIMRLEKK